MAAAIKETVSNLIGLGNTQSEPALREPSAEEFQTLQKKYTDAGQGQVFAFLEELKPTEKTQLYHQLTNFEPTRVNELAKVALSPPAEEADQGPPSLEPLPDTALASILDSDPKDIQQWYDAGLKAVAENKVAVVLMAGGQGTRLGSSDPKGCFDIGLPSHKSLFQIQGERIGRLQQLAQKVSGKEAVIPWYVMTSGPTRKPTEAFFQKHNYFGLSKDNVVIFEQGILPCISNEGKIMMESKSKVRYLAPCPVNSMLTGYVARLLLHRMETVVSTRLSSHRVCGRTCVAVVFSTFMPTALTTVWSRWQTPSSLVSPPQRMSTLPPRWCGSVMPPNRLA